MLAALAFLLASMTVRAVDFPVSKNVDDGSVNTFRWAIDQVNTAGAGPHRILFVGVMGEINLGGVPAVIQNSVVIDGPGARNLTITAPTGGRVLMGAVGTSIEIKDLTLEGGGGNPGFGGAVYTLGNLEVRRCWIKNFEALQSGAIYCTGSLTIHQSTLSANTATQNGGAIVMRGIGLITNSTFSENRAGTVGGAISVTGTDVVLIKHCTMYQNRAETDGGGIHSVSGFTQVTESIVIGVPFDEPDLQLGGLVSLSAKNFTFGDPLLFSLRRYESGVPYHLPHHNSPVVDRGTVGLGASEDQRGSERSSINVQDLGAIEVRTIIVNTDAPAGAGSLLEAVKTSNNPGDRVDFISLTFGDPSGATTVEVAPLIGLVMTRGTTIVGNYGEAVSGFDANRILDIQSSAVAGISKVILKSGNAGGGGGGAALVYGALYVDDSKLESNVAGFGAGIVVENGGRLELNRSTFEGNIATTRSGAIEMSGSALFQATNCYFNANESGGFAGHVGIYALTDPIFRPRFIHCTFTNGHSSNAGGGIYLLNGFAEFYNCYFANNNDDFFGATHMYHSGTGGYQVSGNVLANIAKITLLTQNYGCVVIPYPDTDSPARDAGDPAWTVPFDMQGSRRPGYWTPDAGAVEYYRSSYEDWHSRLFSEEELCDPLLHLRYGPLADQNGDGILNVAEFLLDGYLQPGSNSVGGAELYNVQQAMQTNKAIQFDADERALAEFGLVPQYSANLITWANMIKTVDSGFSKNLRHIEYQSPLPVDTNPSQFFRMNFSGAFPLVDPVMVGVGKPGNAAETTRFSYDTGRVDHHYLIGKFEITKTEWILFLNAVDPNGANLLGLYHINQYVLFSPGKPAGQKYSVHPSHARYAIGGVSYFAACRFCNWLHNGATAGAATESGAYTLAGNTPVPSNSATVFRSATATFALPNIHEFYKAGHYDGTSYSIYPQGKDVLNNMVIPGNLYSANYGFLFGSIVAVGSFPSAASPWGAKDMGGNAAEWTETSFSGAVNYVVGGYGRSAEIELRDPYHVIVGTATNPIDVGFRVIRLAP